MGGAPHRRTGGAGGEFRLPGCGRAGAQHRSASATFTAAFEEAGIPYLVNRGSGFYDTREVERPDPPAARDRQSARRNQPGGGVALAAGGGFRRGPAAAEELRASNLGAALMGLDDDGAASSTRRTGASSARFRERLREWRMRREYVSLRPPAAGGDRRLRLSRPESGGRGDGQHRQVSGAGARGRGAHVARRIRGGAGTAARVRPRASRTRRPRTPATRCKIMTVHSRQGPGVSRGVRGGVAQGGRERAAGGGIFAALRPRRALAQPGGRRGQETIVYRHAIREERKKREDEESSRLLYVAMTRAEQHLALSFSGVAGKKLENWAAGVDECVCTLDTETGRDEV